MPLVRTNRRIGHRYPAAGLYVGWFAGGRRPRRHLLRRTSAQPTAQVLDVSVTGARFATVAEPVLPAGTLVLVTWGETSTLVSIRHAGPGSRGRTEYGVEFLQHDNLLARMLADHLEDLRPEARRAWELAH